MNTVHPIFAGILKAHGLPQREWITHDGGKCPLGPSEFVDVQWRDGTVSPCVAVGGLPWSHNGGISDIVGYVVVPPPSQKFDHTQGMSDEEFQRLQNDLDHEADDWRPDNSVEA
jgi:hypothetical protein